jgi:hypothetical protein
MGTADAILEAASKAHAEVRDQLYTQAAWKVFNEGGDEGQTRRLADFDEVRAALDYAADDGGFAVALA